VCCHFTIVASPPCSRLLNTGDFEDRPISPVQSTAVLFAWDATSKTLGYHDTNFLLAHIDFSSVAGTASTATAELSTTFLFHGLAMVMIFLALMPAGTYVARFGRYLKAWPVFHKSTQSLVCTHIRSPIAIE
jgi:hypothetical protein